MPKSAAERKRDHRARMREQGLVPVECWVLKNDVSILKKVERKLQEKIMNFRFEQASGHLYLWSDSENAYLFVGNFSEMTERQAIKSYKNRTG